MYCQNEQRDSQLYLFFFNDTATTEIYTLSLHDALPIARPRSTISASKATSAFALSSICSAAPCCSRRRRACSRSAFWRAFSAASALATSSRRARSRAASSAHALRRSASACSASRSRSRRSAILSPSTTANARAARSCSSLMRTSFLRPPYTRGILKRLHGLLLWPSWGCGGGCARSGYLPLPPAAGPCPPIGGWQVRQVGAGLPVAGIRQVRQVHGRHHLFGSPLPGF